VKRDKPQPAVSCNHFCPLHLFSLTFHPSSSNDLASSYKKDGKKFNLSVGKDQDWQHCIFGRNLCWVQWDCQITGQLFRSENWTAGQLTNVLIEIPLVLHLMCQCMYRWHLFFPADEDWARAVSWRKPPWTARTGSGRVLRGGPTRSGVASNFRHARRQG